MISCSLNEVFKIETINEKIEKMKCCAMKKLHNSLTKCLALIFVLLVR